MDVHTTAMNIEQVCCVLSLLRFSTPVFAHEQYPQMTRHYGRAQTAIFDVRFALIQIYYTLDSFHSENGNPSTTCVGRSLLDQRDANAQNEGGGMIVVLLYCRARREWCDEHGGWVVCMGAASDVDS